MENLIKGNKDRRPEFALLAAFNDPPPSIILLQSSVSFRFCIPALSIQELFPGAYEPVSTHLHVSASFLVGERTEGQENLITGNLRGFYYSWNANVYTGIRSVGSFRRHNNQG